MTRDQIRQGIFGISDGASTTIGAMYGLYAAGATRLAILCAVISAGISATISMSAGEYLSDDHSNPAHAAAMGAGTAIGGLLPGIPFVITTGPLALALATTLTILLGTWVAEARAHVKPRPIAYIEVFGTFITVATITYLVGNAITA